MLLEKQRRDIIELIDGPLIPREQTQEEIMREISAKIENQDDFVPFGQDTDEPFNYKSSLANESDGNEDCIIVAI